MNILLCFLWLFSATLSAQQVKIVKGHVCVLSEDSIERSLPYASVVVLEGKDSAFVKGMASDANGSFKLEFIPQKRMEYLLRISYIGMSTIFRKLLRSSCGRGPALGSRSPNLKQTSPSFIVGRNPYAHSISNSI